MGFKPTIMSFRGSCFRSLSYTTEISGEYLLHGLRPSVMIRLLPYLQDAIATILHLVDLEGIEPYSQHTCKARRQPQCLSPFVMVTIVTPYPRGNQALLSSKIVGPYQGIEPWQPALNAGMLPLHQARYKIGGAGWIRTNAS